jgi:hypothetical protein
MHAHTYPFCLVPVVFVVIPVPYSPPTPQADLSSPATRAQHDPQTIYLYLLRDANPRSNSHALPPVHSSGVIH